MEISGRWAKVVAIYQEAHAADVVYLDNGQVQPRVTVLCGMVSTDSGSIDLHTPGPPKDATKPYDVQDTSSMNIRAAVIKIGGIPAIIGFKPPELGQMTFKRKNFRLNRHPSDVYTSIDDNGNVEVFHPSGTYFRIAVAGAHEDLTGQDFDKRFKIARNTDKLVHVVLSVQNGGVEKARVDISPTGDITATGQGNLSATMQGTFHGESVGAMSFKAPSMLFDTATAHFTGNVNVDQTVTATTDAVGGGKSLKNHTHGGVFAGGAHTAAPD
jgi:hypothetical protein